MNSKKLFWLSLVFLSTFSFPLLAFFAGGSGTAQDPWQVATAEHLDNIRYSLTCHYIQTADIDLGVAPWNEGAGWSALARFDHLPFEGNYNGNGHTISGLYINSTATHGSSHTGLFGQSTGTIQNLHLTDVDVKTKRDYIGALLSVNDGTVINCSSSGIVKNDSQKRFLGGLVGLNQGDIINCHSSGNVSPDYYLTSKIGGLVGYNEGNITGCYSTANITNDNWYGNQDVGGLVGENNGNITYCHSSGIISGSGSVGGLVGISTSGNITNSYSTAEVSGINQIGGLVGWLLSSDGESIITNCYSAGQVTGTSQGTGGLVGRCDGGEINSCYSSGSVTGQGYTGGLLGFSYYSSASPIVTYINNCYSSATVSGDSTIGGLVGKNEQSIITNSYSNGHVSGNAIIGGMVGWSMNGIHNNCYWDIETSGQTTSGGGEGRTTADMVNPHSSDTYVDWDWEIWAPDTDHTVNDGYPYLRAIHDDVSIVENILPISQSSIRAFPQPAFQKPHISMKSDCPGELSYGIYNVRGQKIYSARISSLEKEQSFELPSEAWKLLPNGVYFLSLKKEGQKIASSKLVVFK